MPSRTQELTTLRFEGPRFDGAWLPLDVLPELLAYKDLLVETAKELWRREHPSRERLPANFDAVTIKFREIRPGSAAIPLVRELPDMRAPQLPLEEDEFDRAATVLEESIDAGGLEGPLPDLLPRNVIPLFEKFGRTLREGEAICARARGRRSETRYTEAVRQRIVSSLARVYEDVIDIVGEVRMADIDGHNFSLRLADDSKVVGKFSPEQEAAVTEALSEHESRRLWVKGWAEFSRDDGSIRRILRVDEVKTLAVGETEYDPLETPIWEIAEEIAAKVPADAWAKVPADLAKNLKHYLYGAPKRE